jgi:hypothetical protein
MGKARDIKLLSHSKYLHSYCTFHLINNFTWLADGYSNNLTYSGTTDLIRLASDNIIIPTSHFLQRQEKAKILSCVVLLKITVYTMDMSADPHRQKCYAEPRSPSPSLAEVLMNALEPSFSIANQRDELSEEIQHIIGATATGCFKDDHHANTQVQHWCRNIENKDDGTSIRSVVENADFRRNDLHENSKCKHKGQVQSESESIEDGLTARQTSKPHIHLQEQGDMQLEGEQTIYLCVIEVNKYQCYSIDAGQCSEENYLKALQAHIASTDNLRRANDAYYTYKLINKDDGKIRQIEDELNRADKERRRSAGLLREWMGRVKQDNLPFNAAQRLLWSMKTKTTRRPNAGKHKDSNITSIEHSTPKAVQHYGQNSNMKMGADVVKSNETQATPNARKRRRGNDNANKNKKETEEYPAKRIKAPKEQKKKRRNKPSDKKRKFVKASMKQEM